MRKLKVLPLLLVFVLLAGCGIVREDDSTAANATKEKPVIVATSVTICKILDMLEVDTVVGIPKTDAYSVPERYKDATVVGTPMGPDMELVKSLNPDVVISPLNIYENFLKEDYEAAQVNAEIVNLNSPAALHESVLQIGKLVGEEKKAQEIVKDYEKFTEKFSKEFKNEEHPKVLILMGLPGGVYVAATDNSNAGALVKLAGGVNVYGPDGDEAGFVQVNPEDMLQKDPDIILRTAHAMPEMCMAMFKEEFATNDIWGHFRAVQEGRVYDLDYNKFGMSANFLYKEALNDLKPILYGEE